MSRQRRLLLAAVLLLVTGLAATLLLRWANRPVVSADVRIPPGAQPASSADEGQVAPPRSR